MNYDAVILGGGAAGLMCAIEAGKRGKKTIVLERNDAIGEKIRISGGGRCNFTNRVVEPAHYLSENEHFSRSSLARFTPRDFIAMVEKHGIAYHEKKSGQLFCDGSSREIIAMLQEECLLAGAVIRTGCPVGAVEKEDSFLIQTPDALLATASLVVATGGLSVPAVGATDFGYRIARQFGIGVTELRPGLVPLTCSGPDGEMIRRLSGISFDVTVACSGTSFREQLLCTHKGLSGPAILQISSYWKPGEEITIDLLPEIDLQEIAGSESSSSKEMATILGGLLPRRLAQEWCIKTGFSKTPARSSQRELAAFEEGLHHWVVRPDGTEGFGKAEVTCGGIDTAELSSKTMEAKKVGGLYFVGEVIDVTGHLGGYNFQWAWASGAAAGRAL